MATVYLALGSNMGDRSGRIARALERIGRLPDTRVEAVSRLVETEPVGPVPQGPFLNGAAALATELPSPRLLAELKRIEAEVGRVPRERWGPREVDIDIILYGDCVREDATLCLPHPRFRERRFVLVPLAEIAPEARDPVTGNTVRELLSSLERATGASGRRETARGQS